jgi:hypothetical protein
MNFLLVDAVWRILDVYPRSRIRIRIKELRIFSPKLFLSSRKNYLGCSSRFPDSDIFSLPDPGVKKRQIPDPDPQH